MTAELLPCPFCGSTDMQTSSNGIESCFLVCGCGAEGPACFSYVEALEAWNRRTQPPAGEVAKDAGWQDIESRPIESRSYLVCNALGHVAPWIDGVIHNAPGSDSGDWEWGEAITHWQPLPAPPVLPTKE